MYTYSSEWIHRFENRRHWLFYWHQISLIQSHISRGDKILEIGMGSGFTSNYLRSKSYQVKTLDIDPAKDPDIIANLVEYDYPEPFDYVLAFEVFEHIPFEDFEKVLSNMSKVCQKGLLISLPRNEKVWLRISMELPGSKISNFKIATRRRKLISKHHYWEIDYKSFSKSRIEELFEENNFEIVTLNKIYSLYFYALKKIV
ncbi:MAG: class I SAM-dependent methyltransferase [Bacteroidota bacterium]|nr:class I SAM-dependent methyltransferase [Bacteroidota bacterium]